MTNSAQLSKRDARIVGEFLDQFSWSISIKEARVYAALVEEGPMRISSLTEALGMSPSTLSRVLWALGEIGLIKYEPAPDDRRSKIVSAV